MTKGGPFTTCKCTSLSSARVVSSRGASVGRSILLGSIVVLSLLILVSESTFLLIAIVDIGKAGLSDVGENLSPLSLDLDDVPVFRSGRGFGALGRLSKLATVVVLSSKRVDGRNTST